MCIDIYKTAKFAADNWYNKIINIPGNNNEKTDLNFAKIDLAEFGIHIKIFLANNIKKTCYK